MSQPVMHQAGLAVLIHSECSRASLGIEEKDGGESEGLKDGQADRQMTKQGR